MPYTVEWKKGDERGLAGFTSERGWITDSAKPHMCEHRETAEDGAKMLAERGYETSVVEENDHDW